MNTLITEKEKKHYDQIMELRDSPINAGINRVLVIQIREEDEVVEDIKIPGFDMGKMTKIGSIVMPASSKEKMKDENEVVKGVVVSIGPCTENIDLPFKPADTVLVFPSVFETKMSFEGFDYFSYSQRDIVAVISLIQKVTND